MTRPDPRDVAAVMADDDLHTMVMLWQHPATRAESLKLADKHRREHMPTKPTGATA